MTLLFYALFVVIAGYSIYKFLKPYWHDADIDSILEERKFNDNLFERTKKAMTDEASAAAKLCAEKIEKLKNSKY